MTLRLAVRAEDASAEVAATPMKLPTGRYRLQICLVLLQAGQAPWSRCQEEAGDGGRNTAPATRITVGRPYDEASRVIAYVKALRDEGGRSETVATSFKGDETSSLPVPAR